MPPPPPLPDSNTALTFTAPSTPPHLTHTPLPTPSPTQLLLRLHTAAINPVDIQLWASPLLGLLAGRREKGLGRDYAGTVAAVGAGLKGRWEEGERVFGLVNRPAGEGAFSRYLLVEPGKEPVARVPRAWTDVQAAAVPLVALTAYACLAWLPPAVKAEEGERKRRVVVAGASGGVGGWVVQLAARAGCHVTGICSAANAAYVRGLGADEVLDYGAQDVVAALQQRVEEAGQYDLYVDCVGGTQLFGCWTRVLSRKGAYVTIVGDKTGRTALGGPVTYFTYPAQVARFVYGYFFGPRYANVLLLQQGELLEHVARLADEGGLQVVVQDVVEGILDEEEHGEAWEKVRGYMEGGRVRGKIVVRIAD
ncbi:hypothetical protein C7974DRAFT_450714 [Boeremia exigua]|uniref:uncharacterized protein n=1 Tax=Boeremia exigua TaxID=749465 RepID=UPI001E8E1060|nr:uncharacterized protein C7974DRAFT_450714 [Boeremia exigua]KAH6637713.1 hypothetical protein C7974DRAFT_450714 [Boeremia exigua]